MRLLHIVHAGVACTSANMQHQYVLLSSPRSQSCLYLHVLALLYNTLE